MKPFRIHLDAASLKPGNWIDRTTARKAAVLARYLNRYRPPEAIIFAVGRPIEKGADSVPIDCVLSRSFSHFGDFVPCLISIQLNKPNTIY